MTISNNDTSKIEVDYESDDNNIMGDLGFMFDSEQAVHCRTLSFRPELKDESDCNSNNSIQVSLECVDDDPGHVQSGHYLWPASPALAQHLVNEYCKSQRSMSVWSSYAETVIELGSGCGLGGCIAMQLPNVKLVVFTDHDPGCIDRARANSERTVSEMRSCASSKSSQNEGLDKNVALDYFMLSWGDKKAASELLDKLDVKKGFDLVIGSDLIYDEGVVEPLLCTISMLLGKKDSNIDPSIGSKGKMIMTQSFAYEKATETAIEKACTTFGLKRVILKCELSKNGIRVSEFFRI